MSDRRPGGIADLTPLDRRQRAEGLVLVRLGQLGLRHHVATVLFAPYLITVAEQAPAGCVDDADETCSARPSARARPAASPPGSLPFYLTSFATIAQRVRCCRSSAPCVDRSARKKRHMAGFAWAGAFFAALLFFVQRRRLAARRGRCSCVSSILGGCSLVVYYAILCDISTEDERDRVSSRGWALGYLGGGLLLLVNLVVVLGHDTLRHRHGAGGAAVAAVGGAVVGGVHARSRSCGCATDRRGTSCRSPAGCCQRSFGQLCDDAAGACATTR